MHKRGLVIDIICMAPDQLPTSGEEALRIAAESLDWYAEEGYGIGDAEFEDGENINSMCEGYIVGEDARFAFSDGTYVKEIGDALADLEQSGCQLGVVVCNISDGWMEEGLDFGGGEGLDVAYDAVEMMRNEYSYELEDGQIIVGVLFDAKTYC